MNALLKKEIRLLLPSWSAAMLLAMVQAITRPYDFYVASLLFFGLTLMALTTIGREASLNTFSSLLAQPAERIRIWQTKLVVLAVGFLSVFIVWVVAFGIAFVTGRGDDTTQWKNSYNLFFTICLIASATFTGGLWTTLLLRQIAGAFWLTLLVPAVLSGFAGGFLAGTESDNLVIAVLCVVIGVYSVGGFLFARWLFFKAQDVGWSGGVIALPEWQLFARAQNGISRRTRQPLLALVRKEFQLHQVSLLGAAGLLVLHLGVIALRKYHLYAKDSAGEALTSAFWILWLVLPPILGSMAVAEERRLGVLEGQLCLPVTRRLQFAIKASVTLLLGILLGGVLPMLLEAIGILLGAHNPMFGIEAHTGGLGLLLFQGGVVFFAAALTLISFFASTLARSFLQAVGLGVTIFFITFMLLLTDDRFIFHGFRSVHSALPGVIAVPTIILTLLGLAYLNYKDFRPGWPLWRRNLLGGVGAFGFVLVASLALYHRVWENFQPAEPAHGPAQFARANPARLTKLADDTLMVRLPDGRIWFDRVGTPEQPGYKMIWLALVHPFPVSSGPHQVMAGSNWVSASARHVDFVGTGRDAPAEDHVVGYLDTLGIQADGTLWISQPNQGNWPGGHMDRFGDVTHCQQIVRSSAGVFLLKTDGTLGRWGTNRLEWSHWRQAWPSLRTSPLRQFGTASDWQELSPGWDSLARKTDGSVWRLSVNDQSQAVLSRQTNLDQMSLPTLTSTGNGESAGVGRDGTLWLRWESQSNGTNKDTGWVRAGMETNWTAVALNWNDRVALKADGSLWQWRGYHHNWDFTEAGQMPPTRLGIHQDWVAITATWKNTIALAADGSLWLWPDRDQYYPEPLLELPKQPQRLENVVGPAD